MEEKERFRYSCPLEAKALLKDPQNTVNVGGWSMRETFTIYTHIPLCIIFNHKTLLLFKSPKLVENETKSNFFRLDKVKQDQEVHILVIKPTSNIVYLHSA